jgi:hypothetical protein
MRNNCYLLFAGLTLAPWRSMIEYKTFLDNSKLIIVRSNEGSAGLIKDQYPKFLEYIRKKRQLEQNGVH